MNWLDPSATWWPQARAQALVQGDAPALEQEPSLILIVLSLLGAFLCTLPLAGLLALTAGFDIWFESPLGYVLMVAGLLAAGYQLRKPYGVFGSCMVLVAWMLFHGLLLARLAVDLDQGHQWEAMRLCVLSLLSAGLQLVAVALGAVRWIQRLQALMAGVALYLALGAWLQQWMGAAGWMVAPALWCAAWLFWIWREPQRLQRQPQPVRASTWAAVADAGVVGVFLAALTTGGRGMLEMWESEPFLAGAARPLAPWLVLLLVLLLVPALLAVYLRYRQRVSQAALLALMWLGGWLLVAAWLQSALVFVGLLAAGALMGGRWRMLVLCGLAALWLLGQYYYTLQWTLATKALGLALLGLLLLAGLWLPKLLQPADRDRAGAAASVVVSGWSRARLLALLAGAVLVFATVNWDVRSKEQVIAHGTRILISLVPVDPRSLMQGDYMALNFEIPPSLRESLDKVLEPRVKVLAQVDAEGRARVLRMVGPGESAGPGHILLPLQRLKGRWVVVTDAFFFTEGEGEPYEKAQYGDFRVLPDGRALLVGLADAQGQVIGRSLAGDY